MERVSEARPSRSSGRIGESPHRGREPAVPRLVGVTVKQDNAAHVVFGRCLDRAECVMTVDSPPHLHQRLGLFDTTTIVVGSMIGSGIFFAPSIMAQWVQTPGLLLGLWVFAGVFTFLGALADLHNVCLGLVRGVDRSWRLPVACDPTRPGTAVSLLGLSAHAGADLVVAVPFLLYVVLGDPQSTLIGLGLMITGVPVYFAWRPHV